MYELDLKRWHNVWLSKPFNIQPVESGGIVELNGVKGYLIPGDLAYLFNLAALLPSGGNFLEVGSWKGLSGIMFANGLLANLNTRATVYCVDTWKGSSEHQSLEEIKSGELYNLFWQNVTTSQMDCFIKPIIGDSVNISKSWSGPKLDMIFIDGDHSQEACYNDILSWLPHLITGGRLFGHDAAPGSGVAKALEQLQAEGGFHFRIIPPPEAYHIWELLP